MVSEAAHPHSTCRLAYSGDLCSNPYHNTQFEFRSYSRLFWLQASNNHNSIPSLIRLPILMCHFSKSAGTNSTASTLRLPVAPPALKHYLKASVFFWECRTAIRLSLSLRIFDLETILSAQGCQQSLPDSAAQGRTVASTITNKQNRSPEGLLTTWTAWAIRTGIFWIRQQTYKHFKTLCT